MPYYGLLIISARESSFWLANDLEIKKIKDVKTSIANSHKNGGSSQGRFDRLFENKRDRNHIYIGEQILKTYYDAETNSPTILGFIIGGPADTRTHVWDLPELSHLQEYVVCNIPLPDADPYDLWTLTDQHRSQYDNKAIKTMIDEIDTILQKTPDKIDFGVIEVSDGLKNHIYSKVYISTDPKVKERFKIGGSTYEELKDTNEKCKFIELGSEYLDQYGGCIGIKYM